MQDVYVPGPLETVRASRFPLAIHGAAVLGALGITFWSIAQSNLGLVPLALVVPGISSIIFGVLRWMYPIPVKWVRLSPDALILAPVAFGRPRVFYRSQFGWLAPASRWSPMYRLNRMEWTGFGWTPASHRDAGGFWTVTRKQMERIRDILGVPVVPRGGRPTLSGRPLPSSASSR